MKYNFDEIVTRRGTGCVKWDEMPSDDVIPLWVADMDFKAAPAIQEALRKRIEHGVFGIPLLKSRTTRPSSHGSSVVIVGLSIMRRFYIPQVWYQQCR